MISVSVELFLKIWRIVFSEEAVRMAAPRSMPQVHLAFTDQSSVVNTGVTNGKIRLAGGLNEIIYIAFRNSACRLS